MADDDPYLHLEVRLAGLLIAYGGRLPGREARRFARTQLGLVGSLGKRDSGNSRGSRAGAAVQKAARRLQHDDLTHRDGDDLVADDLPGLAAWLADRLEEPGSMVVVVEDWEEVPRG